MAENLTICNKKIIIVARWPLGGIRTYMRYMFSHFPSNYRLVVFAASSQEDAALMQDVEEYGAELVLAQVTSIHMFAYEVFKELGKNRYDLILSQGFISAVAVYMANLAFSVPHILTIHGIVEPKYLVGRLGALKRLILARMLSKFTALYAVSNDILEHVYKQFSGLKKKGLQTIVILNGIETGGFENLPAVPVNLRVKLRLDASTFLFGFFGRFMAQKGFDLLIDAVDALRQQELECHFVVVAVGSGDYLREYQDKIRRMGLGQYFHFLPFQRQVHYLYPQIDVIVMPSRWEACPLLPMEALCMGTPLIASDCMGLREVVSGTPTLVFPSEDVVGFSKLMHSCMESSQNEVFKQFRSVARARYDIEKSTVKLLQFIENMQENK